MMMLSILLRLLKVLVIQLLLILFQEIPLKVNRRSLFLRWALVSSLRPPLKVASHLLLRHLIRKLHVPKSALHWSLLLLLLLLAVLLPILVLVVVPVGVGLGVLLGLLFGCAVLPEKVGISLV
jgi:hypothetical protein